MEQSRGGGRVRTLAGHFRQRADTGVHARQQAVDQRRLAHPGLPDEHADMAVQARLQLIHAGAAMGRDLQQRIIQLAIHVQEPVQRHLVVFVDQVGLVQQQQRRDARVLGGDEIAVDQVGVRLGERRQ